MRRLFHVVVTVIRLGMGMPRQADTGTIELGVHLTVDFEVTGVSSTVQGLECTPQFQIAVHLEIACHSEPPNRRRDLEGAVLVAEFEIIGTYVRQHSRLGECTGDEEPIGQVVHSRMGLGLDAPGLPPTVNATRIENDQPLVTLSQGECKSPLPTIGPQDMTHR